MYVPRITKLENYNLCEIRLLRFSTKSSRPIGHHAQQFVVDKRVVTECQIQGTNKWGNHIIHIHR